MKRLLFALLLALPFTASAQVAWDDCNALASPAGSDTFPIHDVGAGAAAGCGEGRKITVDNVFGYLGTYVPALATSTADGTLLTIEGATPKEIVHDVDAVASTIVRRDTDGAIYGALIDGNAGLSGTITDAGTNNVVYPSLLSHRTSGAAAANYAVGEAFYLEDASGGVDQACTVEALWTDATAGSEDADFVIKCRAAGAAVASVLQVGRTATQGYTRILGNTNTCGYSWSNDTDTCLAWRSADAMSMLLGGGEEMRFNAAGVQVLDGNVNIVSTGSVTWNTSAADAGLTRDAAGGVRVTDGTTGYGYLVTGLEDAGTTTVLYPNTIRRTTNGTAAAGLGGGIDIQLEDAGGNVESAVKIEGVLTDATAGSGDADLVMKCMAANAAPAECGRITSTKSFQSPQDGSASFAQFSEGGDTSIGIAIASTTTGIIQGGAYSVYSSGNRFSLRMGGELSWTSANAANGTPDTLLRRNGTAGVISCGDDTASSIRCLLGGGAAVASAAALPVPTGRVFHVTGTTNVTSMTSTNFEAGVCVTLIFDGVLTFTDGNNLKLAGDFVTTADDTISLCYDGTNWYETARSIN